MSTPTSSARLWRRSSARRALPLARRFAISRTALRETSPRSCASARMLPRLTVTRFTIAGERPSSAACPEVADGRHAQLGQQRAADERLDVEVEMLAVLVERGALQPGELAALDPFLAGRGTVTVALSATWVPSRTSHAGGGREGVGFLLPREGLEPPLALLIDVVDDPRLLLDALAPSSTCACGSTLGVLPFVTGRSLSCNAAAIGAVEGCVPPAGP